jgi:hypothetical protein
MSIGRTDLETFEPGRGDLQHRGANESVEKQTINRTKATLACHTVALSITAVTNEALFDLRTFEKLGSGLHIIARSTGNRTFNSQ